MLNFFQSIVEYIEVLFTFITNTISSAVQALFVIVEALTLPQILSGYCFPILGSSVIIVSAIAVIKVILGR